MKKVKLIYNPFAGDTLFKNHLDSVVDILQNEGNMEVHLFRVNHFGDIEKQIETINSDEYYAILISGGDGSINLVVNAMKKNNLNIPLGIFPSGTANDFSTFLGIPKTPVEAARVIVDGIKMKVDIGQIAENYFINVVCVGLFATISQSVDPELKNSIGKLAYYIKGAELVANPKSIKVKITTSTNDFEVDAYIILIMNSSGAGGFSKLAPNSDLSDGKFDLLIFKSNGKLAYSAKTLISSIRGKHIEENNVIYYQDSYFKIECLDDSMDTIESDIDGEKGPNLPFEIKVKEKALEIFVPENVEIVKKNILNNLFKD